MPIPGVGPYTVVREGDSVWLKMDPLGRRFDQQAKDVFGAACTPDTDLVVPCPGTKQLTFGPATATNNDPIVMQPLPESQPDLWRIDRQAMGREAPGMPIDVPYVPSADNVMGAITKDKDLYYRMNRWANQPEEGVPSARFTPSNIERLGPVHAAEHEYDEEAGGPDEGRVRCDNEDCTLQLLKKENTDARSGQRPTDSFHHDGWDVEYKVVTRKGRGMYAHGNAKIHVCVKGTFKCTPPPSGPVVIIPIPPIGLSEEEFQEWARTHMRGHANLPTDEQRSGATAPPGAGLRDDNRIWRESLLVWRRIVTRTRPAPAACGCGGTCRVCSREGQVRALEGSLNWMATISTADRQVEPFWASAFAYDIAHGTDGEVAAELASGVRVQAGREWREPLLRQWRTASPLGSALTGDSLLVDPLDWVDLQRLDEDAQ